MYRFKDNGSSVTEFETYVGGKFYKISTPSGVYKEDWAGGNDNLTFDSRGNLWVLQDGGRNHVWVVKAGHTQAKPKVELFMKTPVGSEPTGMTFTPDEQFMFISIQTPATSNTQSIKDAKGKSVIFNKSTTISVARKEKFDVVSYLENKKENGNELEVYPNPSLGKVTINLPKSTIEGSKLEVRSIDGLLIDSVNNVSPKKR